MKKDYWDFTKQEPFVEIAARYMSSHGKALDIGCGDGRNAIYLAREGFTVCAVDVDADKFSLIHSYNLDHSPKISTAVSDILAFTSDEQYDLIVCDMVLHFLTTSLEVDDAICILKNMTARGGIHAISAYTDKNAIGKRPYLFMPNELRDCYEGWEILQYNEVPTKWFLMPGEDTPRRNEAVYLIARKKYNSK